MTGAPSEQAENLQRVTAKIGAAILDFCKGVESIGQGQFRADDLRRWVAKYVGPTAPGSADRVLRDLRQRGLVRYRCISRASSLYQLGEAGR